MYIYIYIIYIYIYYIYIYILHILYICEIFNKGHCQILIMEIFDGNRKHQ